MDVGHQASVCILASSTSIPATNTATSHLTTPTLAYVISPHTTRLALPTLSAPVEEAVQWAHEAIMANHGQNCSAGSRTFVHQNIYDEFVMKAKNMAENRFVGDPWNDVTQQGPQVNENTL